ncbi:hypothetical protein CC86DRAFT_11844 [Ophiobolus disseminans]|uniref:Uncharacterized protein n=1 Tax=Ophiobolus disseminans TaxID=1469910 RepID=A0A6A7AM21_9PLEO|nr:hypothetical protein CC86DRAFT_11844 [Ophiobolus disseminans]
MTSMPFKHVMPSRGNSLAQCITCTMEARIRKRFASFSHLSGAGHAIATPKRGKVYFMEAYRLHFFWLQLRGLPLILFYRDLLTIYSLVLAPTLPVLSCTPPVLP